MPGGLPMGADSSGPVRKAGSVRLLGLRLATLVVSVVVALLLGEGLVRLAAPQPAGWLDIFRRHPRLATYSMQPNAFRVVDTGEGRWTVQTDADGFRVGPVPRRDGPVTLLIGDSFAFGLGVDYPQTFAAALQTHFADSRVVDAGVNGYGPVQYRQTLDDLLWGGMNPSRVIVSTYPANDFFDCGESKDLPVLDGIVANERTARAWVKRHSQLFRLVSRAMHRRAAGVEAGVLPEEWKLCRADSWNSQPLSTDAQIYRREFASIARTCRERSIPLLVVVIPFDLTVAARGGAAVPPGVRPDLPDEQACRLLAELKIPYCDATDELAAVGARAAYFPYSRHLTAAGNAAVARCLVKALDRASDTGSTRPAD